MSKIFTIFIVLTVCVCVSQAQTRKTPLKPKPVNRAVIIKTTQGQSISGNFLGANTEAVRIEDSTGIRVIKLDNIINIAFGQGTNSEQKEFAREAIKALQRLASATSVGINFQEYSKRMIDVKGTVDEALRKLEQGPLRDALESSYKLFEDALLYWRSSIQENVKTLILSEQHITELRRKYGPFVESAVSPMLGRGSDPTKKEISIDKLVSAIWTTASNKVQAAEDML